MPKLITQLESDQAFHTARDFVRELVESNINKDGSIDEDNLCIILNCLNVKFNNDGGLPDNCLYCGENITEGELWSVECKGDFYCEDCFTEIQTDKLYQLNK